MNNSISMIMYHYVRPVKSSKYPKLKALEIIDFKKQILWFKKNYDVIGYDDFLDTINKKKISGRKKVILTFDDGYKDHYNYVLPELKKNKISGFFYPPSKIIENKIILDVNKLHFILEVEVDRKKIINEINYYLKKYGHKNIFDMHIQLKEINSRYDDLDTSLIKKLLQYILPKDIRAKIINKLFNKIVGKSVTEFSSELYMNKENLTELYNEGMHVGSHGEFHTNWGKQNKQEQEKEILNSLNFFKKLKFDLNKLSVCYPYGSYNKDTLKLVKKHNFKFGITTKVGPILRKNLNNKFLLPRLNTNDFLNLT